MMTMTMTMTMTTTTTTITKTVIMAGATIIKYQKKIQLVIYPMMIMTIMMATQRITMTMIITSQEVGIITPNMRNMKMIMLMKLKVMVKMQMTSNKLKKILV